MRNFTKGVITGVVSTMIVMAPIAYALDYHDQVVNRAAKADKLKISKKADRLPSKSEPVKPKTEWTNPSVNWTVHKATDFCYLTNKKYPGLTVTQTHISFTVPADKDRLGYIEEINIQSIFGDVTRRYTKDIDITKISDTITYMVKFDPLSRISDFGTGGFLNINEHVIDLKGSALAWSQLIRCSKGLEPDF